ncbi:DUF2471 family protein [Burkholderia cenocepacia]|uniref:DUF2471 family protein n=1 Tax=Burkholderia cenocepacia TaxID=95486 RepID=UPI002865A4A6|nr:DUF2471 family protein [Burkholderia cenocepacia]MDR8050740.1 DUF2471 domain-containing protein [Burkholderia cenocepacia]MDV3097139.1 DUF2471 domain-containing protein [Burkholderia cenocepacia]
MDFFSPPPDIDQVLHDAAADLMLLIVNAIDKRPDFPRTLTEIATWRMLIEIETDVFSDALFSSKYGDAVVNAFFKIPDEHRNPNTIDEIVDFNYPNIKEVPFVLAVAKMLLKQRTTGAVYDPTAGGSK